MEKHKNALKVDLQVVLFDVVDVGMGFNENPVFESFKGDILKEWEGKLSMNGTIEGVISVSRN